MLCVDRVTMRQDARGYLSKRLVLLLRREYYVVYLTQRPDQFAETRSLQFGAEWMFCQKF